MLSHQERREVPNDKARGRKRETKKKKKRARKKEKERETGRDGRKEGRNSQFINTHTEQTKDRK